MRENSRMPSDVGAADLQPWAVGWRRLALACGMLVYPLLTVGVIHEYLDGAAAVIAYAIVAAFCVCYFLADYAIVRRARPRFWALIGVMTALFLVLLPLTQEYAFYPCAVIVALVVIPLRRRAAPVVVVAAAAALVVPALVPSWRDGPGWTQAVMIVFTALIFFAFTEMARANQTLVAARAEVAELAAEAERNRIARDLHDLVGHSLTAITVKSNLARQLAETEDSASIREIAEIETLSRQALADVRAAVSGYHEVTLAGELARARELLRAAGVAADLPTALDLVDPARQELFGWIVREGITNVVRHARASSCTVTVSGSSVEIRDDGIGGAASWGHGITGLRERIDPLGGRVEAGPLSPRGWRLHADVGPLGAA